MSSLNRFEEDWVEYSCCDCDPTLFPDDEDDVANRYAQPYVLLVPTGEVVPDVCPRCGSYLSFCKGAEKLRISNTPYERYAARHRLLGKDESA